MLASSRFRVIITDLKTNYRQYLLTLAFFALLIYAMFVVGRGIYQNAKLVAEEGSIKNEIAALKVENERLRRRVEYQQTQTFREKEARLKLGFKAPGETAVVVPETRVERADEPTLAELSHQDNRTNWQKWWDYFFPTEESVPR